MRTLITDTDPVGKHRFQGADLLVEPAQTLATVAPFLEQMGITRVANVTGLDRIGIPVVMVCRPNSRSIAVSQGKGITLDAAKASGPIRKACRSVRRRVTDGPENF